MNMKKLMAKIVVAVALTLAVLSSGIIGNEIGVPIGPSAQAECLGGGSGGSGGGGC